MITAPTDPQRWFGTGYVTHVLGTGQDSATPHGTHIDIPEIGESFGIDHLGAALDDPRVLWRQPVGAPPTPEDPTLILGRLLTFARWLDHATDRDIPPDLRSRAARYRFLVWSLPLRGGGALPLVRLPESPPSRASAGGPGSGQDVASTARQDRSGPTECTPRTCQGLARTARQDWIGYLAAWEDDPWLGREDVARHRLESELRWIMRRWPEPILAEGGDLEDSPLDLGSTTTPGESDDYDRIRIATLLAEQHWLPRSSLWSAAVALVPDPGRRLLAVLAGPALATGVLVLFLLDRPCAPWVAAGVVAAGLVAAVVAPAWLTLLGLMRLPAAAAVGAASLLAFTSHWWLEPTGWYIGLGLLVFSGLYLAVEARAHGATRAAAAARAVGLLLIGALYTFVLSLVVLVFLVPVVGEHGQCLNYAASSSPWRTHPVAPQCLSTPSHDDVPGTPGLTDSDTVAAPASVLLLMTGWAFAVGLVLQVLWDDRPVTAPLGRTRRVRGGA